MDRYRLTSPFNGIPPQKPNFLPNAPSQISLPTKPHLQNPHIFPYLRPQSEETAVDSLTRATDDTEISIFDAERYFNESHDSNLTPQKLCAALNPETQSCNFSPNPLDSSFSSLDGLSRNFRSRSFRTTPTASSEASWNSQAGLLRKSQASVSVSSFSNGEQRKEHSSSARRLFAHTCPCFCKKSVDVEKTCSEPKAFNSSVAKATRLKTEQVMQTTKMKVFPKIRPQDPEIFRAPSRCFSLENPFPSTEIGCFSFPALAPQTDNNSEDEPARVSLEVFRPAEKAPFFTNAGDRRSFTISGSPKPRPAADDDAASDTSSDLFEIESLTTHVGFRRRDSLDEIPSAIFEPRKIAGNDEEVATPSTAPSECYPPSEVSVVWSVTTNEGFDRSSLANFSTTASEYERLRYAAAAFGSGRKSFAGGGGAAAGGISSCRSEKAVCIAGPNSEWFEPESQRRLGNPVGLDRVMSMARIAGGNPVHDGSGPIGLSNRSRFV